MGDPPPINAMSPRRAPAVAVIGPSRPGQHDAEAAEEAGALLAGRGMVVVCGGLGGVMEAASRGAASVGGTVVGILPGTDAGSANPFVSIAIATGMNEARNAVVVNSGDAVLAIGKGFGTLSEVALALRAGKPVVSIGSWEMVDADMPRFDRAGEAVEWILSRSGRPS